MRPTSASRRSRRVTNPRRTAILIDHHGHVAALGPHVLEQLGVLGFRYYQGWANQRPEGEPILARRLRSTAAR